MDSTEIKAELLKKRHGQEALLNKAKANLDVLLKQTDKVETKIDSTKTELELKTTNLDSIKQQIDEINQDINECSTKIESLQKIQLNKHSIVDLLNSNIKLINSDIQTKMTTLTADYNKAIVEQSNKVKDVYDQITNTRFKSATVNSKDELIDLINSTHDSVIIVNPNDKNQFTIDTTNQVKLKRKNTPPRLKGDACGCQTSIFESEYKLQKQIYENSDKTEYHLIIKLPSKHIDFVSSIDPRTSDDINLKRDICPVSRWNTNGQISSHHKLNATSTPCKIEDIETGPVNIISDPNSYELTTVFKGNTMTGNIKFTKLNSRNQQWNMKKSGD